MCAIPDFAIGAVSTPILNGRFVFVVDFMLSNAAACCERRFQFFES